VWAESRIGSFSSLAYSVAHLPTWVAKCVPRRKKEENKKKRSETLVGEKLVKFKWKNQHNERKAKANNKKRSFNV
jgi:hypothetical protein